jgi:hypothetical protein
MTMRMRTFVRTGLTQATDLRDEFTRLTHARRPFSNDRLHRGAEPRARSNADGEAAHVGIAMAANPASSPAAAGVSRGAGTRRGAVLRAHAAARRVARRVVAAGPMRRAHACYGVSLQLGRLKSQRPTQRPGPHLQLGRLNRVAGATRLGLHFGVLHLQHAQILSPSTLNPSTFNSQSGSNLLGSCPQPSPCLVGGTGSLGAHRPEPRSMPYAIVVGSRPQPRGCLQGLQPSRHPHVHLNPPVLHCRHLQCNNGSVEKKRRRGGCTAAAPRGTCWRAG